MNCSCWRPVVQHLITSSARTKIARGRRPKSCGTSKGAGRGWGAESEDGTRTRTSFFYLEKNRSFYLLSRRTSGLYQIHSVAILSVLIDKLCSEARHGVTNCSKQAFFHRIFFRNMSHYLIFCQSFQSCVVKFLESAG